jgi:DNA polymerase iota
MHVDLLEDKPDHPSPNDADMTVVESISDSALENKKRWLAHPKTLRLTTRPRPPPNPDGSRSRTFNRISRSAPIPNFLFNLTERVDVLAERLVADVLVPLFRKLHPEKSRWNLSLVNIAVVNIIDAASDNKDGMGRDISKMFKTQDNVLKQWKVQDRNYLPDIYAEAETEKEFALVSETKRTSPVTHRGSEDVLPRSQDSTVGRDDDGWYSDGDTPGETSTFMCDTCGAKMPTFAMLAHSRWHLGE